MEGEFNNLQFNNANITFNNKPNNIETSDELKAPTMYQDNIEGTVYARKKRATKVVALTGITLLVTAASIASGSIISNAFILNPPVISDAEYTVVDEVFNYKFTVENKGEYDVVYTISIGTKTYVKENCSVPGTYVGVFNENKDLLIDNQVATFYLRFSNKFDYTKQLVKIKFNKGGIINE